MQKNTSDDSVVMVFKWYCCKNVNALADNKGQWLRVLILNFI